MRNALEALVQDLRYAARQLRRAPGFTITALLTLTLAIGATTATVSVLRATLLNPMPYPGASQLVSLSDVNLKGFKTNGLVTVARAIDLAQAPTIATQPNDGNEFRRTPSQLFKSSTFLYFDQPALVIDGHAPISTSAVAATGDFFRVLGSAPLLGRSFTTADDSHGAPEVVVLSYGLWRRAFSGDPAVLGKTVLLAGKATAVIGVMPPSFDYPSSTDLWRPAHLYAQDFSAYRGGGTRFVHVIGRLNDSIGFKEARQSLTLLAGRLRQSYPATDGDWGFDVTSLRSEIFGSYRSGLLLLAAAVGILLLIATANVAGLQLSRNARRQPEMAMRRALGVSSGRLVQQLLTESLLLLFTGCALGIVLAVVLLRVFVTRLPATLLSFERPHLDVVTLGIAIAVALLAGLACALVPALHFGKTPSAGIVATPGRAVANATSRFGRGFASIQIALALVLLTLASSLLQNLYHLLQTRLGYDPSHVLTVSVHLPFGSDPSKVHRFHQQLEQQFAALPGVDSVGAIDALPLSSFSVQRTADIVGQPPTPHRDAVSAQGRTITPSYLTTMRIPLLAGRNFTERDSDPGAPPVIIVNQTFASRYFPGGSALGRRLAGGTLNSPKDSLEIVGIVGDVHGTGGELASPVGPEIDQPEQGGWPYMNFVLRTAETPATLEPAMRRDLASINPAAALGSVSLLSGSVDSALRQPRLSTELLTALAGLALLLVLLGVYGVIAFSVTQRTRELGVRMALGSTRPAIFRMLLSESAAVFGAGLLLGTAGAIFATRLLIASIAGVQSSVTTTVPIASVLLALAVLAASLIPARRAALIDPMEALRAE